MEAARRAGWVLDHWADIESDMSVFHRIDDVDQMDAPRFFQLARRLIHYRGALRDRLMEEANGSQPAPGVAGQAAPVDLTPQAVQQDPALRGLVEYSG